MADTALKLVLLGADRSASSTLRGVQGETKKTGGMLTKMGGLGKGAMLGIAGAALAAIPAIVDFGKGSLDAFAEAQKSQRQLEDAYKRFPKVASVSIDALQRYNQALQRKTGADADDIASGQAVLARYKLTGQQLKAITPLLVDYANRTGKSIPDAAKAMGKALGGSSRLAKELGFSFKDAKDPAANFSQVMAGLEGTVGGYTDKMPEAAKKQQILAASFEDLQENVGEKLAPAMMGLVDAGQGVLDWLQQTPEVGEGAAAVWDLLGMALQGLWWLIRKGVIPSFTMLLRALKWTADGAASMLDALGNVPGFGWAKTAATKLRTVSTAIDKVANAGDALSRDPIAVNVKDAEAKRKMASINSKIRELSRKRIELKSQGDTSGVKKIDQAIAKLKRQRNKISVGVGLTKSGPQTYRVDRRPGSGFLRYAASGTPYSASGALTWVGEQGPELMRLPAGSRVFSNGQSRAMASRATVPIGGDTINIIAPPGVPRAFALSVEDELVKLKQSRGRGGKLRFQ